MRHFHEMVFMGVKGLAEAKQRRIHKRLKEGLSILSALQQGGHCMPKAEAQKLEKELQDVVKDIGAVFGRSVRVGRKLPYPRRKFAGAENAS